jgi:hypothetical protein
MQFMTLWASRCLRSIHLYLRHQGHILARMLRTCNLFHHWPHHQAPMSLRELWMGLCIMIIGITWLAHQMGGPCTRCHPLISIITIGHICRIPMPNPTVIMGWLSSQGSLSEQWELQGLTVISNAEGLLFLHHTSAMGKFFVFLHSHGILIKFSWHTCGLLMLTGSMPKNVALCFYLCPETDDVTKLQSFPHDFDHYFCTNI